MAWEPVQREKVRMKMIAYQAGAIRKSPELKIIYRVPEADITHR